MKAVSEMEEATRSGENNTISHHVVKRSAWKCYSGTGFLLSQVEGGVNEFICMKGGNRAWQAMASTWC